MSNSGGLRGTCELNAPAWCSADMVVVLDVYIGVDSVGIVHCNDVQADSTGSGARVEGSQCVEEAQR